VFTYAIDVVNMLLTSSLTRFEKSDAQRVIPKSPLQCIIIIVLVNGDAREVEWQSDQDVLTFCSGRKTDRGNGYHVTSPHNN
jgi:hypothetical protein